MTDIASALWTIGHWNDVAIDWVISAPWPIQALLSFFAFIVFYQLLVRVY